MLDFKSQRLREEFEAVDTRLQVILYAVAGFVKHRFDKDLIVTSLLRDDLESVHGYRRGADVRTSNFSEEERDEIVEFVNSAFHYDSTGKETLFDERDRPGAPHFHLQVDKKFITLIRRVR